MQKLIFAVVSILAGVVLAKPSTYNDLGDGKQVVTDYWDTRNRPEVTVDVDTSASSAEVSSAILWSWDYSSVCDIWSTPFTGLLLFLR